MNSRSTAGPAYPLELRAAERKLIDQRRASAGLPPGQGPADGLPDDVTGVGLSGGGIRSATFYLGIFMALAEQRLIRRIDLLSTVSGGGFFGSFLGRLFTRNPVGVGADQVEQTLANSKSFPVSWLRQNGRYMSPTGSGDTFFAVAIGLRNWLAVHAVLGSFCLLCFLLTAALESLAMVDLRQHRSDIHIFWWSPIMYLPLAILLFVTLPMGIAYWFVPADGEKARSNVSRYLSWSLGVSLGLLCLGLLDSAGQTIYSLIAYKSFVKTLKEFSHLIGGLGVIAIAQRFGAAIAAAPSKGRWKMPVSALTGFISVLLATVILVGLSTLAHAMIWGGRIPADYPAEKAVKNIRAMRSRPVALANTSTNLTAQPEVHAPALDHTRFSKSPSHENIAYSLCGVAVLCLFLGRTARFLNLSSQHPLYAARLTRAYLGASNPARQAGVGLRLADPVEGDGVEMNAYRPFDHGGPLHIVNVTLNETAEGKHQTECRDRKGLAMAVGPAGLSIGHAGHALWGQKGGHSDFSSVEPIQTQKGRFHLLASAKGGGHKVEPLGIGQWVAISGAAFSTGIGAKTSLSTSLLMGMINIRLGYWWNSEIKPSARDGVRTSPILTRRLGEFFTSALPVQSYLLDEFLARFHGPARERWYLSDGGHFENTAAYELIRRRVPFILICDDGRDTDYSFEDLANLIRLVRTDFGAEISFFNREQIQKHVPTHLQSAIGTLDQLRLHNPSGEPKLDTADGSTSAERCRVHATLAAISYRETPEGQPCQPGRRPDGILLIIKPSLTGDEPLDVVQYKHSHLDFPQESTMDQYFDEAQWESYRKLGEHIGRTIFGPAPAAPAGGVDPAELEKWQPRDFSARKILDRW